MKRAIDNLCAKAILNFVLVEYNSSSTILWNIVPKANLLKSTIIADIKSDINEANR